MCTDWTKRGLDFHSLWGWEQTFSATVRLVLFPFSMNRRKIRIIFKANFYSGHMIGFPSLAILLPHLAGKIWFVESEKIHLKPLQKFIISPRLLGVSFSTWCFFSPGKKESLDTFPSYFQPETSPRAFTYAIYGQNIARYFRGPSPPPPPPTLIIWFIFMFGKHLLTKTEHSKLLNKVLTFFSERKGLKIILKEHHFHTGWIDYSSSHGISCIYLNSSHKTTIVSYKPRCFFSVRTGFHTSCRPQIPWMLSWTGWWNNKLWSPLTRLGLKTGVFC